ncbi:MAG: hypothetical protein AB1673_06815 [Actinomycetota bacterium]
MIVSALAIYFVVGGITWAIMAYEGRDAPESFTTLLATLAGGLFALLTQAGSGGGSGGGGGEGGDG